MCNCKRSWDVNSGILLLARAIQLEEAYVQCPVGQVDSLSVGSVMCLGACPQGTIDQLQCYPVIYSIEHRIGIDLYCT
eukprot:UN07936